MRLKGKKKSLDYTFTSAILGEEFTTVSTDCPWENRILHFNFDNI